MDYTQNIASSPTFCPAPWTSLNINQLGLVMPCMHSGYQLGNIKEKSIIDILQGQALQSMKQAQIAGQWHPACNECKARESYGLSPRQQWAIAPVVVDEIQKSINQYFRLEHLTVNWSNLCNLACTYCNDQTSTAWQAVKQIPISHVKNEHDSLIDLVAANSKALKGLSLGGGEPLLQKTLPNMLSKVDPSNVAVMVTTNLSVDLRSNAVYNLLRAWPNVIWMISFDTADKNQFEYVRHGASWEQFVKNIEIMQHDQQHIMAHPAYSVYCALDLDPLYQFCFEKKLTMFWCDLFHPQALDIRYQNSALRQHAIDNIDLVTAKWQGRMDGAFDTLARYRQQLVDPSYLQHQFNYKKDLKTFCLEVEKLLQKPTRFEDLWPHVYQLL